MQIRSDVVTLEFRKLEVRYFYLPNFSTIQMTFDLSLICVDVMCFQWIFLVYVFSLLVIAVYCTLTMCLDFVWIYVELFKCKKLYKKVRKS